MKGKDLQHLVQLQLGWDNDLTQQVLAQIKQLALEDRETEIDEIVQNYMADSLSCQEAVQAYVKQLQNEVFGPGMKPFKRPDYHSNAALSPAVKPKAVAVKPKAKPAATPNVTAAIPAQTTSASALPTRSVTVRKGNVSKHTSKFADPAQEALKALNRQVFNCLSCGKVYDLREKHASGLALMRNGGACTFCGSPLPEAVAAAAKAGAAAGADPDAPSSSAQAAASAGADAAAAEDAVRAREFADRLLEFDRTSAARTEVIDDQGDYFEIDSNQWLDAGERAALRQRQAMQEALEADRRTRVTVTVDLIGREVVRVEKAALDERIGFVIDENRRKAAVAAVAARASMPEGGGSGAAAAEAAARGGGGSAAAAVRAQGVPPNGAEAGRLREFRMRPNLAEGVAAPMFRSVRKGGRGCADGAAAAEVAAAEEAEGKQRGTGGRQRKKKSETRAVGKGQAVEGMDVSEHGGRDDRRSVAGGKGQHSGGARAEGDDDDAASKERQEYRRRGGGGSRGGEAGLKSVWQRREEGKQRNRRVLQDDRTDDIFDRFVEDVEVLYGDTTAAEKLAGGCG